MLGAGMGLAVPFVFPTAAGDSKDDAEPLPIHIDEIAADDAIYVDFGEEPTVVNIKSETMGRFLNIAFSMKIAESSKKEFGELLEKKMIPLTSWLITHLSDKTMDDIRGEAGQNRLRREIRDQFNTIIFPRGGDRVFDILFSQFAVQ